MDKKLLFKGTFGIEKENLRVDINGRLATTDMPKLFEKEHPFITTDFSESQIEMITPVMLTLKDAYNFLDNINQIVSLELDDEFLWPQSNPPILPIENDIPIAKYTDIEKEKYREYLSKKYGKKRAVLSGVHFNFAFDPELIRYWYEQSEKKVSFIEFSDALYLKVTKYFLKENWFFVYLFGASPIFHETYIEACVNQSVVNEDGTCIIENLQSLRNSTCGFKNKQNYILNFRNIKTYKDSIHSLIAKNEIVAKSELYVPIRLKEKNSHIEYLEFRMLDLNPLFTNQINLHDLELLHMFALFFAAQPDFDFTEQLQKIAFDNQMISTYANKDVEIFIDEKNKENLSKIGFDYLNKLLTFMKEIGYSIYNFETIINDRIEMFCNVEKTYASILKRKITQDGYIPYHLKLVQDNLQKYKSKAFNMLGYEDLELSTQMVLQAAIKKGLYFEVLDRKENFIRIIDSSSNHTEYIKEATKTSKDKYSQVLVMENKLITKQILDEHKINVPSGITVFDEQELESIIDIMKNNNIVIKPNNSNFGKGITILFSPFTEEEVHDAYNYAKEEDETVIIEKFYHGKEFRFLIIDDKIEGIIFRRPASIVGDGMKTIAELVELKNQNPLRGVGYHTPLEKIKLSKIEQHFLMKQGFSFDSVVEKGKRVYLRENSNISTGGDSIDYTDLIPDSYKKIALDAANYLDVKICGVDMIINDIQTPASKQNYAIIEVNFNPAIHIHGYPFKGVNRKIGDKVIDLLFPNIKEK